MTKRLPTPYLPVLHASNKNPITQILQTTGNSRKRNGVCLALGTCQMQGEGIHASFPPSFSPVQRTQGVFSGVLFIPAETKTNSILHMSNTMTKDTTHCPSYLSTPQGWGACERGPWQTKICSPLDTVICISGHREWKKLL